MLFFREVWKRSLVYLPVTHRAVPYGEFDRATCVQKFSNAKSTLVQARPSCIQLNDMDCVEDVTTWRLSIRQVCRVVLPLPIQERISWPRNDQVYLKLEA